MRERHIPVGHNSSPGRDVPGRGREREREREKERERDIPVGHSSSPGMDVPVPVQCQVSG